MFSLYNRYSLFTLSFITLHQLAIAMSVYASVNIIYAVNDAGFESSDFKLWCIIYLLCMVFPYGIAYFSHLFRAKWLCAALSSFWSSAAIQYGHCTDKNDTDNIKGVLVTQGKETIEDTIDYSYYSLDCLLNFGFSLLVVSIILDYRFFLSILVSSIFIVAYKTYISLKMERLSETRANNGSIVSKKLSSIHENYHHGSSVNIDNFKNDISANTKLYLTSRMSEEKSKQAAMLITSLCSLIPTSALVVYLLFSPTIDSAIKLGIVVNLTRIYHILASANELVSMFILLPNIKGQLKILTKFNNLKPPFNIETPAVEVKNHNTDKMITSRELTTCSHGLLSIIGRNGSGKTSYLRNYQREIGGLYFNPSYRVSWPWGADGERDNLSDGEYTKRCLEWLVSNTTETLLLDEWDAFLDKTNTEHMEALIASESNKRLILQVRQ